MNNVFVPDHTLSSLTSSAVVVWILQQLKSATWFPWVQEKAATANRVASALLAALGTAGLAWQWTPATHTLSISNLSWSVVALGVWHWIQHFSLQEVIYQGCVNQRKAP